MKNKFRLRPSFITLCVTALLLSVQFTARASTIRYLDIDQMLAMSELVFEGRVVSEESRWDASKTFIFTYIKFEIDEVIVGNYQSSILELRFDGGVVGEQGMMVEGSVFPNLGEKGIYFVESVDQPLVNPLVGWSQGHFLLERDLQGNDRIMTNKNKKVIGLNGPQRSEQLFSHGIAGGVRASAAKSDEAMAKTEFKRVLKDKMRAINEKRDK